MFKILLNWAFAWESMSAVRLLLKYGAPLEEAPENSLITAIEKDDYEMVELLITHGFDVNKIVVTTYSNDDYVFEYTALYAACSSEDAYKMVQLLFKHGAVIHEMDDQP